MFLLFEETYYVTSLLYKIKSFLYFHFILNNNLFLKFKKEKFKRLWMFTPRLILKIKQKS